jgi:quercetin dioxygenase-like cupin family protein/DNA-binding XRE family transcriptional regulator
VPVAVLHIGERIRTERARKGISLRGLARSVGLSPSLISQIETSKCQPSVSTLYAITTALGVSVQDVFGELGADGEPTASGAGGEPAASGEGGGPTPAGADGAPPADGEPAASGGNAASGEPAASAGNAASGGNVTSGRNAAVGWSAAAVPGPAAGPPQSGHPDRSPASAGPVACLGQREVLEFDSGVTWERLGHAPGGRVDFLLVSYAPGGCSSPAGRLMQHPGTEYGYLIQGELVVTLGSRSHRLVPGDAVSFASATPHSYRNEGTAPAVGVWFVASPDSA